jgi:hypothetical protein
VETFFLSILTASFAREDSHDRRVGDQLSVPLVDFQPLFRGGTAQFGSVAVLEVLFLFSVVEWPGFDSVDNRLSQVP